MKGLRTRDDGSQYGGTTIGNLLPEGNIIRLKAGFVGDAYLTSDCEYSPGLWVEELAQHRRHSGEHETKDEAEHNGVKSMNMTMGQSTAGSTIIQVMVKRFAATRGDAGAGKPSLSRRVIHTVSYCHGGIISLVSTALLNIWS